MPPHLGEKAMARSQHGLRAIVVFGEEGVTYGVLEFAFRWQ
jgi:hypothetical protein